MDSDRAPFSVLWVEAGGDAAPAERLDDRADITVTVEADYAAAIEAVDEHDCVVADHRTGGIDGLDLLERVRADHPERPVFLVPSEGGERVASRAVDADVTGYVPREGDFVAGLAERIRETAPSIAATDDRTPIRDRSLREEFRLKELAMDQAPVGITIADATRPDDPLIYVNDAFTRMTGYSREESIGVNCRFLQGRGTDPERTTELREAVDNEESVTVELLNYHKDGTEFWNRLSIYPMTDETGEVSYYAGFQTDITELKRVRRQLREERRTLQRVLDRVGDLASDIGDTLARVDTEEAVRRVVTDRLGSGGEYDAAWFGEIEHTEHVLEISEWSGNATAIDETTVDLEAETGAAEVLRAVVETGELRTVERAEAYAPPVAPPDGADGACALVPLVYGETTYGVMAVYSNGAGFDDHEVDVLRIIGLTVGEAISAHRSRRVALADTGIEVAVDIDGVTGFPTGIVDSVGATMELDSLREREGGGLEMLFTVGGVDPETVTAAATTAEAVEAVELLADREESVFQFVVSEVELVDALADQGARPVRMRVTETGTTRLRFETDGETAARAAIAALEETAPSVELVAYKESAQIGQTTQGFRAVVEERFTERQLETLQKAHVAGFFEWPREVEGDELADSMGVVPSTFHQHLRAAERKLVDAFFDA